MKVITPVLRPVHKVSKRTKAQQFELSGDCHGEQIGAQPVDEKLLATIRAQLTILPTCSTPLINRAVHDHLNAPTQDNKRLLDGWEYCGRQDFKRHMPVKFTTVAREVCSALGLACLYRYARGYLDEAEAAAAERPHQD